MSKFVSEEVGYAQPTTTRAIRVLEEMMRTPDEVDDDRETVTENKNYQSNAENAFLQYANLLETINADAVKRKRKTGKRKKTMPSISLVPNYKGENVLRENEFNRLATTNKTKISEKKNKLNQDGNNDQRLQWYGDPITFTEEWPSTESRDTFRVFHINHNGITYHNDYLEWEMSIAYLMDMQVDVFGITEPNLDFNNKIVKDDFIQRGRFFDSYMHMAVSSSLRTVGKTPFKMGGTVTGVNGCWSGRVQRSGSEKLGRWSYTSMRTKKGKLINVITCYVPRKPSTEKGQSTIYSQMELDILQTKKSYSTRERNY